MKSNRILYNQTVSKLVDFVEEFGYYVHQTTNYIALRHKDNDKDPKFGKRNLGAFALRRGKIYFESTPISRAHKEIMRVWQGFEILRNEDEWMMFGAQLDDIDPSDVLYLLSERLEYVEK